MGMKKDSVLIILPCLQRGTDSNFPYSKELVSVGDGVSLVDLSFRHILSSRVKPRVALIVGPHGSDIAEYVQKKYKGKVDLVTLSQKKNHKNLADAVRSVKHLFGDKNILLVPSSIIEHEDSSKVSLVDEILGSLDNQPFVFVCKREDSVTKLRSSGVLNIQKEVIIDFEDKPLNAKKYNAFWVSFGFKKVVANEVLSVIRQSGMRKANFKKMFKKSVMYGSLPINVDSYADISTWTNLNAYLLKQYLTESGVDPLFLKIRR